jgi:hypothetical protein
MDYVTVEDRIASAAVAGADSAAAGKSKRRSGGKRRSRKEKQWQRLHAEAVTEMNANLAELLAHMPADYHPYVASAATVETMSAEAALTEMNANLAELLAHMPAGHPRLAASPATLGETPVMEATLTCRHCGDRRLETEPPCGCDSVVAEYGSISCDCCGYSYMDCRGQRDSPSSATAGITLLYYEQYGWWIREPCASCSPAFVERMRAVQKADRWQHQAEKEWEYEQMCRGSYW